eukprot:8624809-Pyramimonas_sp.AAC.1
MECVRFVDILRRDGSNQYIAWVLVICYVTLSQKAELHEQLSPEHSQQSRANVRDSESDVVNFGWL